MVILFLTTNRLVGLNVARDGSHPTNPKQYVSSVSELTSKQNYILRAYDVNIVFGRMVDSTRGEIIEGVDAKFLRGVKDWHRQQRKVEEVERLLTFNRAISTTRPKGPAIVGSKTITLLRSFPPAW